MGEAYDKQMEQLQAAKVMREAAPNQPVEREEPAAFEFEVHEPYLERGAMDSVGTISPGDDMFAGIEVDGIDKAYVWIRSFTPSWLVAIIFLCGLGVAVPLLLKKYFGVEISIRKK